MLVQVMATAFTKISESIIKQNARHESIWLEDDSTSKVYVAGPQQKCAIPLKSISGLNQVFMPFCLILTLSQLDQLCRAALV